MMQRILIPTDFSPVADNALQYAVGIAAAFDSELLLYHAYHIHQVDYDLDLPEDEQPYRGELAKKMKLTKLKFIDEIERNGLSLRTILEEDSVFPLFDEKARELEVDLIVMGSKGASGLERVIFGSVAARALRKTVVPLLVIPPAHPFQRPGQIVLATDLEDVSPGILAPLRRLASGFGAKVTVLHVNADSRTGGLRKMDLPLNGIETAYREVRLSESINESINGFIEKNECDLLCMIRRKKGFFEDLFEKSVTKNQVYQSEVPLLVLPEK